jgi:hypothetical protein
MQHSVPHYYAFYFHFATTDILFERKVSEGRLCFTLNTSSLFQTPVITAFVHCELGVLNSGVAEVWRLLGCESV